MIPTDSMLYFQKNLNVHVIWLERGDFKLSIGSFNDKFSYTIKGFAKHFAISIVFVKSRFQRGSES